MTQLPDDTTFGEASLIGRIYDFLLWMKKERIDCPRKKKEAYDIAVRYMLHDREEKWRHLEKKKKVWRGTAKL